PADGEEPPSLKLMASDGPAVLPTGPDSPPVPAHQVECMRQQLLTSTPNTPLSRLSPLSEAESTEQLPLGASSKDPEA
ncbi:hypothetical protein G3M53_22605, partial [Streptomyces sp. SID7982]|nr:hypothetical protein [Streptomyces sp. SID7982]